MACASAMAWYSRSSEAASSAPVGVGDMQKEVIV